MGQITYFRTKYIKLRISTPEDILESINSKYNKLVSFGDCVFCTDVGKHHIVKLDIKLDRSEERLFFDFIEIIKPYICGHKKKEFIGEIGVNYEGCGNDWNIQWRNIYIDR